MPKQQYVLYYLRIIIHTYEFHKNIDNYLILHLNNIILYRRVYI